MRIQGTPHNHTQPPQIYEQNLEDTYQEVHLYGVDPRPVIGFDTVWKAAVPQPIKEGKLTLTKYWAALHL